MELLLVLLLLLLGRHSQARTRQGEERPPWERQHARHYPVHLSLAS